MRTRERQMLLLSLALAAWGLYEQYKTRRMMEAAAAVLNADPLTLDALKKRMKERAIDRVMDLLLFN